MDVGLLKVLRSWRLERFDDVKVKVTYQKALQDEVLGFTESVTQKVESGMKGESLVQEVVHEWEDIVNRVAKSVGGEKTIVCGKSARWWDNEIKDKINRRHEVYTKVISGTCRLRKEVKEAVREKKLSIWNEVVEKVNADFEGSRKEFWAFVGRRTKGKYKNITSLKSKAGVSVSSTQGKLEVLWRNYEELGKVSVDDNFEADWKEEVISTLETCRILSEVSENVRLDRQIDREEIAQCVKNNKTGGCDGIVGELLKYGSSGMVCLLPQLFSVVWREELVPRQWREGLIVNLLKWDKEDPGNYRGITLLSVVGKVFCKILNNRLVERLDRGGILHEGQAGFRVNRSCMDNVKRIGRLRENKIHTHSF